jgi:small subunit ribosomal protein S1
MADLNSQQLPGTVEESSRQISASPNPLPPDPPSWLVSDSSERESETPEPWDAELAQMLEDYSHFAPPADGEILRGHVVSVRDTEVIVDVGLKSEGLVPIQQLMGPDGTVLVSPGDEIEVMVDRHGEKPAGFILLSYEKAARLRIWQTLEEAWRSGQALMGQVTARTRGGLIVNLGVDAFLPASQVHVRPSHDLEGFVGQQIPVKILKLSRRRGNVVVSRKLAIEEQEAAARKALLEQLYEGAVLTGIVKNLTDYGAFIDLGGLDGLLHVSDISYGRIHHPSEVLNPGDEVTVKVLKFDRERERVSLGMKQLLPDPWENIAERYTPGSRVIGRVVSIADYGAFLELEPGVEGLIHVSEMTWSRRMKHPSKVVKIGDHVEAVVLDVRAGERRISLGLKQLEADPWTTVPMRYSVGSVVQGRVRKLVDFGAFVEIEEGVDGLVHISDMSWTKRIAHPSEVVKKGQLIQAAVLAIDAENRRMSLGIKQLQPDAWETFFQTHQVGDLVTGKVVRTSSFGAFVELLPGVEGLCHISEIPGAQPRKGGAIPLAVGEERQFRIIKLNEAEKRIGLSVRAVTEFEERERLSVYQRQAIAAASTLDQAADIRSAKAK